MQALSQRKAELKEMVPLSVAGKQRMVFEAPSRGLIGFRSTFATLTRGTGILHRAFSQYGPHKGPLDGVRKGVLISMAGQQPKFALCPVDHYAESLCVVQLFWARQWLAQRLTSLNSCAVQMARPRCMP